MSYEVEDFGYNDSNRAFLQAFMARSTLTFDEAKPVLAAIFTAHEGREILVGDITEADFSTYITAANTAISPFDFEIRSIVHQNQPAEAQINGSGSGSDNRIYALVNTTSDPLTQLATTYTADEIAFVKRVLDAMFETYNTRRCEAMAITSIQAIQLAKVSAGDASRRDSNTATNQQTQGSTGQSLTMSQAESMMKRLVEEGWFELSRRGFYSLSPRALIELRGWLVETYNDEDEDGHRANRIKFCTACREIITMGQRCGNRDCSGRLHETCMPNSFRMQQAERCPVCKEPWPGDKFVGEKAVTSLNQHRQGKRRSNGAMRQETSVQNTDGTSSDVEGADVDG